MVLQKPYYCIYRKPKTLETCSKCLAMTEAGRARDTEKLYCNKHNKYANIIYEVMYHTMDHMSVEYISMHHLYKILVYIYDRINITNTPDLSDTNIKNLLFVEVLNKFSKDKCYEIYSLYYNRSRSCIPSKPAMIDRLYKLCHNTYQIEKNISSYNKIIKLQRFARQYILKSLTVYITPDNPPTNTEDPFSYDDIQDIPKNRLFTYYDSNNHLYAFDALELDFFIQKCTEEEIVPYNPYTREAFTNDVLKHLDMFISYNELKKKDIHDGPKWTTHLQAFTDLSIEIEKGGFYNCPDWFMKMTENTLLKSLKLFKDFSADISESYNYFVQYNKNTFIYDFCREGISLFKDCNEDKYILCCNFIKALAFYSHDFYNNLPEWLVNTQTASRASQISNLFQNFAINAIHNTYNAADIEINNLDMIRNSLLRRGRVPNNRFVRNEDINSDNFLLYYYVEYMQ